jgi:pimeloyl-ACP methyl ester carboxylesterase
VTTTRIARLPSGIVLPYTEQGDVSGLPIILLHAWGESRHAFSPLLARLPPTLRVSAPDQRGHRDADKPESGYELSDYVADLAAFLDALQLDSAVILGSSSGGYVAQRFAIDHPGRTRGLVLVGSPLSLRGRPAFADEVERLSDPVDRAWVRASLEWYELHHPVPDDYLEDRVEDGVRMPARVWQQALGGLTAAEPPTEAGTITAPTLVLWGGRDTLLPGDTGRRLAAAIPASRLITYQDTGHLVLWEVPERIARDVVEFASSLRR